MKKEIKLESNIRTKERNNGGKKERKKERKNNIFYMGVMTMAEPAIMFQIQVETDT